MNKYFDCAATALPNKCIIQSVLDSYPKMELFGNPSSIHTNGIQAKNILELARTKISNSSNCDKEEIVFTSGGTESDNMAIKGIMLKYNHGESEMITSKIEHPAILNTCKELESMGYVVHYIGTDLGGIVNLNELSNYINEKTKLISIMAVNNEIGTIQPLKEISNIAHKNNIIFHSDMVQTVGMYDIDLSNIDMASFSGHKFGGLKGTGILYKKPNVQLKPLINGGGQENDLRSGTENVFGNMVMAECLEKTLKLWNSKVKLRIRMYRDILYLNLKEQFGNNIMLNGSLENRVNNNLNISFRNIDSRTLQLMLSQDNIQVSTGSACHSNKEKVSHVLKAIGVPKEFINGAIRITIPIGTTNDDIKFLESKIIKNVNYLYKIREV